MRVIACRGCWPGDGRYDDPSDVVPSSLHNKLMSIKVEVANKELEIIGQLTEHDFAAWKRARSEPRPLIVTNAAPIELVAGLGPATRQPALK